MISKQTINILTTILGFIVIISSIASVFIVDNVSWYDSLFGGFFGIILIYFKNDSIKKLTKSFLLLNRKSK